MRLDISVPFGGFLLPKGRKSLLITSSLQQLTQRGERLELLFLIINLLIDTSCGTPSTKELISWNGGF
jgi:hypothetical protein